MIKILYVITKSNWGGAQRYVYDLAASLDKERFDISVAAGSDGTVGAGGNGTLTEKLSAAGIRTIPIPFLQRDINIIKEFLSLFALIKIFRKERPDIIHLNSSKIGGLGAVAAFMAKLSTPTLRSGLRLERRSYKPKIIFTTHGWGFNEDLPYLARVTIFIAQWLTVLFCHKIIALSPATYNQAMYFPFVRKKIYFVEQGAMPPILLPKEEAKKELLHALNKTEPDISEFPGLWIGCIAELTKNKGIIYLIDAVSILKTSDIRWTSDVKILIIGEGEDRNKLGNLITKYNLQNNVYLLGFVPDAAKYLKTFDIFVLPSITEALGYVLIEAGLAGLPVVATKVGGIPWIIRNEESGFLVPPKDPAALADALKKLLDNENLRQQMGQKNYSLVSQKFSFEKMLKETIDIYNGA